MIFGRVKPLDAVLDSARLRPLERTLGFWQLTFLGIGATVGTGIFVLTSEAAQKTGPAMMVSFAIAGLVCAMAALCYAELAAMIPVAGSAYTFSYVAMGESWAWLVGWALLLEYGLAGAVVSVGWSGYLVGQLHGWFGIDLPQALVNGPSAGGIINLPAMGIAGVITILLILGTRESARLNAVLVGIKIAALAIFAVLALPVMRMENFQPFAPLGWTAAGGGGIVGAAASVFFGYVGFDAVSTAAEETRNPQRNLPLALIASLTICTLLYILVAAGTIGSPLGAQPVRDAAGGWLQPGSSALSQRCVALVSAGVREPMTCSKEALAHVLREEGHLRIGNLIGLAAFLALPSVILVAIFAQTRMFFVMARDGLLPQRLTAMHPRWNTPYVTTAATGIGVMLAAAFLPVGKLADIANTGTLSAFAAVAVAALILRRTERDRHRPFRVPLLWLIAPATIVGCLGLFWSLSLAAKLVLPVWAAIGMTLYVSFGYRHSNLAGDPS